MGVHEHMKRWEPDEDHILVEMLADIGPRWAHIALQVGRSIPSIRNRWQRICKRHKSVSEGRQHFDIDRARRSLAATLSLQLVPNAKEVTQDSETSSITSEPPFTAQPSNDVERFVADLCLVEDDGLADWLVEVGDDLSSSTPS